MNGKGHWRKETFFHFSLSGWGKTELAKVGVKRNSPDAGKKAT